jgi:hypothetical protein
LNLRPPGPQDRRSGFLGRRFHVALRVQNTPGAMSLPRIGPKIEGAGLASAAESAERAELGVLRRLGLVRPPLGCRARVRCTLAVLHCPLDRLAVG